jgi:glycosyltransferase involved in cell wall biosynthesis
MLQIAVFQSHVIQHFAPWWQELGRDAGVRLKVFHYSPAGCEPVYDPQFGRVVRWDVDLLSGYEHEFLPRRWPFFGGKLPRWYMLNSGIKRAVAERSWDAVLVFGYNYLNNWLVARHCRRRRVPLLHIADASLIHARLDRAAWKLRLKRWVVTRFFRRVGAFLTPGNSSRDYLRYYGVPDEKIWFCPLPVDVARFRQCLESFGSAERGSLRRQLELADDDFVVTFNGKLQAGKRPQDLAAAVGQINDPRLKALFIGSGPLEEDVRRLGGAHVRMAGFVNQADIPKYIALGDVAVMPSSLDQHPLAVTESLGIGVPVLLSDRCGCHGPDDVLRHGENGFVYRCADVDALAGRIIQLRDDAVLRRRLGERGREIADLQTPQAARAAMLRCLDEMTNAKSRGCRSPVNDASPRQR